MGAPRPLFRLGIADLEELFKERSHNAVALAELDHELAQRRGTRSLALRARIQRAQKSLEAKDTGVSTLSEEKQPTQPTLFPRQGHSTENVGLQQSAQQQGLLSDSQSVAEDNKSKESVTAAARTQTNTSPKKSTVLSEVQALPQLALEDAYRILKVGAGDTWERVEAERRKLVAKSSPLVTRSLSPGQTQKLLTEAQLANDAAIVIAARRSGRQ